MLAPTLPDLNTLDREALQRLLLAEHQERMATHQQLLQRESEIETLKLLLSQLRRMQFGRKSEKLERQIEQLELRLEDLQLAQAVQEAPHSESDCAESSSPTGKVKSARRQLPAHLPRQTQTHKTQHSVCPDCGGELRELGEDVSEMLEYLQECFRVIRHVRPKLSCRRCERIVQAAAPSRPIVRGMAGPGLLAHVLISKYADHLPLYRQCEIYERQGVELERSTLADWVAGCSKLMEPLAEALRRYVMAASKLHADDTRVPVLAPGQGRTKTGRLWTYVRDDRPAGDAAAPAVWFAYSPDRGGEHPLGHLRTFRGALQADAYAGFNELYKEDRIQEVACWAHVRRKFYDLEQAHASPLAREALERIAALYAIEEEVRGRPPDERRQVRQTRARSLLQSLHDWFEASLTKLSRKSDTTAAIRYALTLWPALTRYCDNGGLEIDNNAAERALRAVTLGRKNYLFAGSDSGGERRPSCIA
jgi:transposase